MGNDEQKEEDGFLRSLIKSFKVKLIAAIIAAIFALLAAVGLIFIDELKIIIRENFFYGSVEVITDNKSLKEHCEVQILDGNHKVFRNFLLKDGDMVTLSPGNYITQVYYPKTDSSKDLILAHPFELKRGDHKKIYLDTKLPNIFTVNIELPKEEFICEEQIYFNIIGNRDGYIWLFSVDDNNIPVLIFPIEDYPNNFVKAGNKCPIPPADSFILKTRSTPGNDVIVGIITESDNQQFAYSCLKKIIPAISVKIAVADATKEELWGYDKKIMRVK